MKGRNRTEYFVKMWGGLFTLSVLIGLSPLSWADKVPPPPPPKPANNPPPKIVIPANTYSRPNGTAAPSPRRYPVIATPQPAIKPGNPQPRTSARALPAPANTSPEKRKTATPAQVKQQQIQLEQKKLFAQKQQQQKLSAQKEAETKARLAKLRVNAARMASGARAGTANTGGATLHAANENKRIANDNLLRKTEGNLPGPNLSNPKLKPEVVASFKDGKYTNRQLELETRFYKYHGIDNRTGAKVSWLTNRKYESEAELRRDLAIRRDWNVKLTGVSEFRAPKGTWISEGIAGQQGPGYPGGAYQLVIENVPEAWVVKTDKAF